MKRVSYIDDIHRIGRDANPFFTLMGIEVDGFGDGRARLRMEIRPDMLNGAGWLQGGIYVALADEACALALYTLLADHEFIATIDEHTSFMKGANTGTIVAIGRVTRRGRRVAFTEGEVRTAETARSSPGRRPPSRSSHGSAGQRSARIISVGSCRAPASIHSQYRRSHT